MKVLILPALLILLPIGLLFFILKYRAKRKPISLGLRIVLGFVFIAAGLLASFYAIMISMQGMADKNVQCVTGAVVFIPFGLLIYIIGVPLLLSITKNKALKV